MPSPDHPRRAGVSAFGFGGSNFHCVLEEAESDKTEVDWDGDVQLIAFGANDPAGLDAQIAAWPAELPWAELRVRAAETRTAWRSDAACRLVLPVERGRTDPAKAIAAARALLRKHADRKSWRGPDGAATVPGPGRFAGRVVPWTGVQYPGMMRDLTCTFPEALQTLADADRNRACAT